MQNPKWETDEEFDDGGTPMWRARQAHLRQQARHTITINAPPPAPRTLREWWDSLTVAQCVLIGYFVPMFLMASLIVGGVIFILALDWLERHGVIHPQ